MSTKLNHSTALNFIYAHLSEKELDSLRMSSEYVSDETKDLAARYKASQLKDYNASPAKEHFAGVLRKLAHIAAKNKKLDETLLVNAMLTKKDEVSSLVDTDDRLATYVAKAINARIDIEAQSTKTTRISIDVARLKKMYKAFGSNAAAVEGCANFFGITKDAVEQLLKK